MKFLLLSTLAFIQIVAAPIVSADTLESAEISNNVQIPEIEGETSNTIEFDLTDVNREGELTETILEEDNTLHTITLEIEPEPNKGFAARMLANKTYNVKHTANNSYTSSFKIDVHSNKIQRAHSGNVKVFKGSMSGEKLTKISSTKAKQTFKHKYLLFTVNRSLTVSIANNKVSITVNP